MYNLKKTHFFVKKGFLILQVGILIIGFLIGGCATNKPTTDLFGKATHTGTVTILRVDDAWHPDDQKRGVYKYGDALNRRNIRFVPLRYKADVAGLDGPDRIITGQDLVTISFKSAFVKYFKEFGGKDRKGEIAVVLSFSAGTTIKESILIYASQGQTLGSPLNVDDWPVIGPINIDGESLLIRVTVIELDQAENEQAKKIVRALASTATAIRPDVGVAMSIAQPIVEMLINLNADDVIADQRFALQRVEPGLPNTRDPLLFGQYVLVLQEDSLRGDDATVVAPRSVLPPVLDRLRFDTHSHRLYKVYNYYPVLNIDDDCPDYKPDIPTFMGKYFEGIGLDDWASFFPQDSDNSSRDDNYSSSPYRKCILDKWINRSKAIDIRQEELGYQRPELSDLDLYSSLDKALKIVFAEGVRHNKVWNLDKVPKDFISQFKSYKQPNGEFFFEYPVASYPESFTLLAQYPLHTHLVLSINRSLGGEGGAIHDRYQAYKEFLEGELKSVRDTNLAGNLATSLQTAINTRRRHAVLFKKVAALGDNEKARKICLLAKELPDPDAQPNTILSDAPIYNEMFHITGQMWNSRAEAISYLNEEGFDCKGVTDTTGTTDATGGTP